MKKIWIGSGLVGILTAVTFVSVVRFLSNDNNLSLSEFLLALICPLISAIVISRLLKVRVLILIGVAYLTFVMPILGPLFGGTGKEDILIFALMGLCGGVVWGTPFALFSLLRAKKTSRNN